LTERITPAGSLSSRIWALRPDSSARARHVHHRGDHAVAALLDQLDAITDQDAGGRTAGAEIDPEDDVL